MLVGVWPQVLYSRYEDGALPVTCLPTGGWELHPDAVQPVRRFLTAKGLLSALTGHPEGRHWSLARYFRLGPKFGAPQPRLMADIYDIWPVAGPTPIILTTPGISIPAEQAKRAEGAPKTGHRALPAQQIGIDLARRSHEVRKLLFAGFGRRMYACGYDPEDVLQEVYKGLLIRNAGKCPWDPAKSSFGHYVHMVCSCILSNYHRKQHRTREMEQVGLLNPLSLEGGGMHYTDVASCATVASRPMQVQEDCLMLEEAEDLLTQIRSQDHQDAESHLAARVLPLLLAGAPPEYMASSLGVSRASLSRALSHLRQQATTWQAHRA